MDTTNTETQAPVITLSEAALKEIKRLINVQGLTEGGLRLGVKGGGCSGLSYTINFDESHSRRQKRYISSRHAVGLPKGPDGRELQIRQSERRQDLWLRRVVFRLTSVSTA